MMGTTIWCTEVRRLEKKVGRCKRWWEPPSGVRRLEEWRRRWGDARDDGNHHLVYGG